MKEIIEYAKQLVQKKEEEKIVPAELLNRTQNIAEFYTALGDGYVEGGQGLKKYNREDIEMQIERYKSALKGDVEILRKLGGKSPEVYFPRPIRIHLKSLVDDDYRGPSESLSSGPQSPKES